MRNAGQQVWRTAHNVVLFPMACQVCSVQQLGRFFGTIMQLNMSEEPKENQATDSIDAKWCHGTCDEEAGLK